MINNELRLEALKLALDFTHKVGGLPPTRVATYKQAQDNNKDAYDLLDNDLDDIYYVSDSFIKYICRIPLGDKSIDGCLV